MKLIYLKCKGGFMSLSEKQYEIEDYFHKKGDCDGSIWTEQGIINFIYEKISQLIKG